MILMGLKDFGVVKIYNSCISENFFHCCISIGWFVFDRSSINLYICYTAFDCTPVGWDGNFSFIKHKIVYYSITLWFLKLL